MADFLKLGNIVSPNGASIIFGAESTEDKRDIQVTNSETYQPYDIVIVEEDTDEIIPAEQISYTPPPASTITSLNAQGAISELEQIVYATTPVFSQETVLLSGDESSYTLSKTFAYESMLVFYNGLLINEGIHFTLSEKTINFSDFTSEDGDILTIIGLVSAGNGGSVNINTAATLIGGSY